MLIEKWLDSERVGRATSLLINFFLFISPQYYLLLIRIRSSFAIWKSSLSGIILPKTASCWAYLMIRTHNLSHIWQLVLYLFKRWGACKFPPFLSLLWCLTSSLSLCLLRNYPILLRYSTSVERRFDFFFSFPYALKRFSECTSSFRSFFAFTILIRHPWFSGRRAFVLAT